MGTLRDALGLLENNPQDIDIKIKYSIMVSISIMNTLIINASISSIVPYSDGWVFSS